jgi:hypothetical protein
VNVKKLVHVDAKKVKNVHVKANANAMITAHADVKKVKNVHVKMKWKNMNVVAAIAVKNMNKSL